MAATDVRKEMIHFELMKPKASFIKKKKISGADFVLTTKAQHVR